MGMFDQLWFEGEEYQTKDTPAQLLDNYKIEQDQISGHWFLWHEEYDVDWVEQPDRFGGGYLKHSNERWVACEDFTGTINFYRRDSDIERWIEYCAEFVAGRKVKITEVYDEPFTHWYQTGIKDKGLE